MSADPTTDRRGRIRLGPSGLYVSFGACVSKAQHLTPRQRQNLLSAEKQCRSQLASMGETAFDASA